MTMFTPKLSVLFMMAIGCCLSNVVAGYYQTNSATQTKDGHNNASSNGMLRKAQTRSSAARQERHDLIMNNNTLSNSLDSSSSPRMLQNSLLYCTNGRTPFSTSLLVTHEGNLEDLTNGEVENLERLIEYVYNRENDRFCDGRVRRITSVAADRRSAVRSYSPAGVESSSFRVRYSILGCCYNCNNYEDEGPIFGRLTVVNNNANRFRRCRGDSIPRRGPDERETVNALNRAIDFSEEQGRNFLLQQDMENINNIDHMMEVAPYRCDDANEFESFVRIIAPGNTLYFLTEQEQELLEGMFMEVYNELTFTLCDYPLFRAISEVYLAGVEPRINAFQEETAILQFRVLGECHGRNCNDDTLIFHTGDVDDRRTRNLRRNNGRHHPTWWGSTREGACYCPYNIPSANRAPTTEEFQSAFNEAFALLYETASSGNNETSDNDDSDLFIHNNLTTLSSTVEVAGFECGPSLEFTALEFIDLAGFGLADLTPEELRILGNAFSELYNNDMRFEHCDGFFRSIGLTYVQPDEVRLGRLRDAARRGLRSLEDQAGDLPSLFQVNGNCAGGCQLQEPTSVHGSFSLFSDSLRRRQQQVPYRSGGRMIDYRILQESNFCFCPIGTRPNLDGAGLQEQILASMDEIISDLIRRGLITSLSQMDEGPLRVRCNNRVNIYNDVFELDFELVGSRNTNMRLEGLFEDAFIESYRAAQSNLCDPFRRDISDLSCVPIVWSGGSTGNRMACNVTFECLGPCEDWIFYPPQDGDHHDHDDADLPVGQETIAPLMFNHPASFQYDVFNCDCLDLPTRGPTVQEVFGTTSLQENPIISFDAESMTPQFTPAAQQAVNSDVQFTLIFYYYYHDDHNLTDPRPEDLQAMPDMVSTFFFDSLTEQYERCCRDTILVYFLTQVIDWSVDESLLTIDITFGAIPEFTVDSDVPSLNEILSTMGRIRISEFLHEYVHHNELFTNSSLQDADHIGFSRS